MPGAQTNISMTECRQGPQGQAYHAPPPPACHPWRRRARHFDPRDDCIRWCAATHQPRTLAQGGAEEEGQGARGLRRRLDRSGIGFCFACLLGSCEMLFFGTVMQKCFDSNSKRRRKMDEDECRHDNDNDDGLDSRWKVLAL